MGMCNRHCCFRAAVLMTLCNPLQATDGRPLSCLAFCLMQRRGLIHTLRLDEQRLAKFLLEVEDRYQAHFYHNRWGPGSSWPAFPKRL